MTCATPGCGSQAINAHLHGRTPGYRLDLCDVCYWRFAALPPTGKMVRFEVRGVPVPKARPRVVNGRTYTPARTLDAEKAIALTARVAGVRPIVGPVVVRCWFFFADRRRRDLDNLIKTVMDALNEIAWADDSQVEWIEAGKYHGTGAPKTIIEVGPLANPEKENP